MAMPRVPKQFYHQYFMQYGAITGDTDIFAKCLSQGSLLVCFHGVLEAHTGGV